MHTFPEAVRTHRERMMLTQDEYAIHLGVSRSAVTAWELGNRTPSKRMGRLLIDKGVDHAAVRDAVSHQPTTDTSAAA